MRRYLSIVMLWARRSVAALLAIVAAMAAGEAALFLRAARRSGETGFERILASSHIGFAAAGGLLLLCGWLAYIFGEFGSRQRCTLDRLSVPRFGGFACHWAGATACYLIFWGAQLGIALGLYALWRRGAPVDAQGPQTLLLAFCRDGFLHALLPLEETSCYVRNALLCAALGASAAWYGYRQKTPLLLWMATMTLAWFEHELGDFVRDLLMGLACVAVIACAVLGVVWDAGREEDDETP